VGSEMCIRDRAKRKEQMKEQMHRRGGKGKHVR